MRADMPSDPDAGTDQQKHVGNGVAAKRKIYYGWVMLPLATIALVASSPGQTFGVSIFNEPIRLELGLSHGQIAAAYMLGTLFGSLPITFIGDQMDRYGLRRTLLVIVSMFCAACITMSWVESWYTLVLAFCSLRMLGPGALGLLSGNALSFWFDRRLGTVEGIRQLGMAAAMSLVPMLNVWLLTHYSWRESYRILGTSVWLIVFPLFWFLLRSRPEDVGQQLDNRSSENSPSATTKNVNAGWWGFSLPEVLRMPTFWILTAGQSMFGLIHTAVFFCIVPIFAERGLTEYDVTAALTVFSICLAATQLGSGLLSDRFRAPVLLTLGLTMLSVAMVLLDQAQSLPTALLAGAAMGTAQGIYFGASHPIWARYFGRTHLGKIRGVLMTVNVGSSSLGPLLAGTTRDWSGDFQLSLILFAIMPIPCAVLSWFANAPSKEQAESAEQHA